MAAYHEHISSGKPYYMPVRYHHKNGSTKWVICRGHAIRDQDGQYRRMVGTHTDITLLKLTEESLRRTNAELEKFAYVASHDLQSPLRHIAVYIQKLLASFEGKINNKQVEWVNYIEDSVQRMQQLIEMLLTYARVSHSLQSIEKFDLKVLVEKISAVVKNNYPDVSIDIAIRVKDKTNIGANKLQIEQALMNLMSNAVKYRKLDQSVSITVLCREQKGEWSISVQDNGVGIDEEYQGKIFEIFQRLHSNNDVTGTGIGLSICKKIVEQHNGNISVKSTLGKGATFTFTIPKYLQQQAKGELHESIAV